MRRALVRRHVVLPAALVALAAVISGYLATSECLSSHDTPDEPPPPEGTAGNPMPGGTLVRRLNPTWDPLHEELGFASVTGFGGIPELDYVTIPLTGFENTHVKIVFQFDALDEWHSDYWGWWVGGIWLDGTELTEWTASKPAWLEEEGTDCGWHEWAWGWRFYNPLTGTYEQPEIPDPLPVGTLMSAAIETDDDPVLSFFTFWQIEGYRPSFFDRMEIYVVTPTLEFDYRDEAREWTPTTSVVMLAADREEIEIRARAVLGDEPWGAPNLEVKFEAVAPDLFMLNDSLERSSNPWTPRKAYRRPSRSNGCRARRALT